jgi:hypothetical protein
VSSSNVVSIFFFFFDKSKYIYKKAQRGATQSIQGVYTGSLKGRGEVGKKVWKTNYNWGKPAGCPSVKSEKKIVM